MGVATTVRRLVDRLILDPWSAVSYKRVVADRMVGRDVPGLDSSWLPEQDYRRLAAYEVYEAYDQNVAREHVDAEDTSQRREYGDASFVVDMILAHLLGEDQAVSVDGASDYEPELETEDPEAIATNNAARLAAEREDALREWAKDEDLWLRLQEAERPAVAVGDTVYVLEWDASKARPRLSVQEAKRYFPDLGREGSRQDEFPRRVHFAWEIPGDPADRSDPGTLRRITYELGPIAPANRVDLEIAAELGVEAAPAYRDGDRLDTSTGSITRVYPWTPAGERSSLTCYLTDAEWSLRSLPRDKDIYHLPRAGASYRIADDGVALDRRDLGIDFLPVVHVPNTPAGSRHFGQSSLAKVTQVLDDLSNADTDTAASSATTGHPIIVVSGVALPTDRKTGQPIPVPLQPGTMWGVGPDGRATTVDTSAQLGAGRDYVKHLQDRMHVISRLPGILTGAQDPTSAPSGYALELSFGPLKAMIRSMRLVRGVKYRRLLKFVQRLYAANGDSRYAGDSLRAEITLGSFLPTDLAATIEQVVRAVTAKVISLETGLAMLVDAGVPIADVGEESARIREHDYAGANELMDAINDVDVVREALGLEPVPQPEVTGANFVAPT